MAREIRWRFGEGGLKGLKRNRLLVERPLPRDGQPRPSGAAPGKGTGSRAARTVTVNLAESPLGWLKARGLVSARQFDAGERLRADWELAQLAPSVTMCWDAPPTGKAARGAPQISDPTAVRIAARRRFDATVEATGPGFSEILWRVVCAGEGMRDAEQALGWPARAGKLVLGMALDRLVQYYRIG